MRTISVNKKKYDRQLKLSKINGRGRHHDEDSQPIKKKKKKKRSRKEDRQEEKEVDQEGEDSPEGGEGLPAGVRKRNSPYKIKKIHEGSFYHLVTSRTHHHQKNEHESRS